MMYQVKIIDPWDAIQRDDAHCKRMDWILKSNLEWPYFHGSTGRSSDWVTSYLFRDATTAMMFKLAWCGL